MKNSKYLSEYLKNETNLFYNFIKKNGIVVFLTILLVVLIYGLKIFNPSYSVDTELMMTDYNKFVSSWIPLERFSLVFLKRTLFPDMFNLYLASVLTYVALSLFCILFCFFIARANKSTGKTNPALLLLVAPLIVSPSLAEQLNFVVQSFEVLIGMIAVVVSLLFYVFYLETKKLAFLAFSVPFVVFSFMSYQSLILFFISGILILLIINSRNHTLQFKKT